MKCTSCQEEINAKWGNAIKTNICPWCGQHIMEEHLKNLLSDLCDTMEKMKQYPDQLDDWLLSNHNYIKTDSSQIGRYMPKEMLKDLQKIEDDKKFQERKDQQKFTVKVQTEDGEKEVVAEKIQSEEKTNDFFKRADAVKPNIDGFASPSEKTQHLKKMVQQIKKIGSPAINEIGGTNMISPEMMEHADPEAVAEFQASLSGGEIGSALSDNTGNDEDVPDFILNANNAIAANRGNNNSSKDLIKLQQMQNRINSSRKNFESGANRGGKGGGFSRA